jgi:hypothetical protein
LASSSSILTDIHQRLDAVRTRRQRVELQSGMLVFGTTIVLSIVIAALFELLLALGTTGRTVLFLALAALFLVLLAWHVLQPLLRSLGVLRSINDFALAAQIGTFFPQIHDRLLNLLQLDKEISSGTSLYSPELVDASFADLAENISGLDFTSSVDRVPVKRARNFFLLSMVGAILVAVTSPTHFYNSLFRLVHFNTEFVTPPAFTFEISPGNKEVTKGQAVEVGVRVHATSLDGSLPGDRALELLWRQEGQSAYERMDLRPDSTGLYRTVLQSVRSSTEYFARLSDVASDHYLLTVIDRPIIRSFKVRLDFPSYSKLPPRVQDEFVGEVSGLPGTRVSLTGAASKDLERGRIVFGNGKLLPLTIRDQKFSGFFPLETETEYHLEITDKDTLSNADPVNYQLKLVPDGAPIVAIEQPGRNIDLAGDQFLPLLVQAKDDFGISSLRLGYRLIHSRYEKPWETYRFNALPLPTPPAAQLEVPYTWDLSPMRLAPEDVVEYFAEAFDNDAVRGPKSARSQVFLIRLPSLEEVFTELDKGHETSIEDLKQTLEEAKQLKEKIESINQDMKQNKEMDWHQQKKMEEMAKKYQDLQKKLNEVQNRLNEMVQKMDQQKVLSPETLEKYLELQQLFDQLNSSELQQALKQMQMAMQNITKEQLQQAMQKLTFSEEQFRQSLERTIDLLKRIQIEQKLDETRKRAEEMQRTQKELSDQTSKSPADQQTLNDVAKKQSDLAEGQKELEKAAADVQKRMEEFFAEMPVDKMQKLNDQMQQQQLAEQMKQAANQLKQGQSQQAQGTQGQVQQQLQSITSQLQSIQQEMLQRQMQHVLNELRRSINNLLELSKQQEDLKDQSQNAPPTSPQLRQNAEGQMEVIRDMGNVINGLVELSKRSFAVTPEMGRAIGEAMMHMRTAMNALEVRNGFGASQEQGLAMGSLNKAAIQVQNAMEAMMQGGGTGMGGLLLQLQMLAGKQESINMQTLQMQQAAEAARIAVGQEAVRKSLEQLSKEAEASGEQKKILGDLDRIAEDMKEVVRNLEQNNVNPETIHRQERILSRLLDASKSMRERDYEKRRKAETGKEIARRSPGELDASTLEGQNRIMDDLLKALQQGYSKDYQELIRKYFDALQKTELQNK